METGLYTDLQLREIFHLEFLRWLARKIKTEDYALKGGANLRFFFKSFRYSEDLDLDVRKIKVEILKDTVMKILQATSFRENLLPFGIRELIPPDIKTAKQTETTQRFKVHLIMQSGEDLFTKIEFSRRVFRGTVIVQSVPSDILRLYKLAPLLIPHYEANSAVAQKIEAIATRSIIQARDIFDLYILTSQYNPDKETKINGTKLKKVYENIFEVNFEQFRDTVLSYLSLEDQGVYNSPALWDEIKLKVATFIDERGK
ncbi:MAG TPA: hypothetical protein DHV62_10290 [Elusimicrobia bacterium]|jgi:predicted nucleotidyltransferase component of viral defense system|nr:hypothetical protein [Elusimicrobiota bacterium]